MTIELSEEQEAAVDQLCDLPANVQTLGGYAGTGKTTVIRALLERLPRFEVCAFTGKAANVLRRKGVESASTIHSLIYQYDEDVDAFLLKDLEYVHPEDRLLRCEGFIVDEASMVGKDIHDDLLSFGWPIIFVGDHGQLEPVNGRGFNLMAEPQVVLQQIHRNAGEIARFAEFIRMGGRATDWPAQYGADGSQVQLSTMRGMTEGEVADPDQVVCAFNVTRVMTNKCAREFRGYPPDRPVVGDRVMCLQNDRKVGVFNGMQGTIKSLKPCAGRDQMVFESDGREYRVQFDPGQFNSDAAPQRGRGDYRLPFDYAYAVTCHKAQGDEWERVLVFEQRCRHWDHSRWAYTAASRARTKLTWVEM